MRRHHCARDRFLNQRSASKCLRGDDKGRLVAPVEAYQVVEAAVGEEAELDSLGGDAPEAGEDGALTQEEARKVRIVGRIVRGAHAGWGKVRPASASRAAMSLV
jgi:hypothetical protein